ncbi:procathepsin L-like isoform X2 [Daphnia pulex]|uniref:procathepsin L-like isoform X2 n=1 Tax=Daphnia pulex TaxID=6669 RepID=UPI001EDD014A|nr:procathepsin L-like isoform X2 [Daphnia pulex]
MKFLSAIILLTVAVAMADKDEDDWNFFKFQFGKKHSPKEEANRKRNFLARQRAIEAHNRKNTEWQMGHNKFSDLSDDEKVSLLGAKPAIRRERLISREVAVPVLDRALPASIDYRTHKCMQPVKDQGQCGSCWSFATIAPLEFNSCNKTGTAVALSEQMLVDCDTTNHGCNGGMYDAAWQFLQGKGGAMKSSSYAYTSGPTGTAGTTCKFDSTAVGAKVASFGWVDPYPNPTAIMTSLQSNGPLPAALEVLDSLYSYSTGVYSDAACPSDVNTVNHAVVIVGYGTTTATSTVPATPYWIIRNSWSTGWGLSGYFMIKRGVNMCNIESWAAYVKVV